MSAEDVRTAFFQLTADRFPLRIDEDSVYVSPEAFAALRHVVSDLFRYNVIREDPRLSGMEMRLQVVCR